jgi:hypothetical protein
MDVVCHPTVRVHPSIEALNRLANDAFENPPVRSAEKDSLAMIASQRDVIETTGHMKAQRTRHPCLPFILSRR